MTEINYPDERWKSNSLNNTFEGIEEKILAGRVLAEHFGENAFSIDSVDSSSGTHHLYNPWVIHINEEYIAPHNWRHDVFDRNMPQDIPHCLSPLSELSPKAQTLIGEHSLERLNKFKNYAEGWDTGRGKKLSNLSIAALERFLSVYSEFPVEPSLFMTHNGNLELVWEDKEGGESIEIEFFGDKVEYYFESLDIEGESGLDEISIIELVSKFK